MNLYQFGACAPAGGLRSGCRRPKAKPYHFRRTDADARSVRRLAPVVVGLARPDNVRASPVAQGHGQRAARRIQAQVAARQARRESAQAGSAAWRSAVPDVYLSDSDDAVPHEARPAGCVAARPDEAAGAGRADQVQHETVSMPPGTAQQRAGLGGGASCIQAQIHPPGALRQAGLATVGRARPLSDCRSR